MRDGLGSVETVLVLGGASDIGVAIAAELARRGARHVVLAGRSPERLEAAAAGLRRPGLEVGVGAFDADDLDAHPATLDALLGAFAGRDVDVVVVAFGVLGDQAAAEADPATATAVLRTNLLGAASALTHLANRLRAQGHGDLVVLSSVAGERVRRSAYVYGASKAGLDGFCQGLAAALVGSGVHLLVVRPGFVATTMTAGLPAPPLATTASAVAVATVDALERRREVVWVPGTFRWVMAGLRHLPTPLFRRLPF